MVIIALYGVSAVCLICVLVIWAEMEKLGE